MAYIKYILPALAATQLAFAAECGDTTISSQSDADGIATCTKISGDITIDESFSGSLSISGVEKITGTLTCTGGENVTDITASSLESIGKKFYLNGLTRLTQLSFSELTTIGSIDWEALPKLQTIDFTTITDVNDVSIANTGLTSLEVSLTSVNQFQIQNNRDLKTINVNDLKNATDLINFSGNYDSLEVAFPNLGTGTNMTFTNISSVSIPSLEKLTGQLGFWSTQFTTFYAPNLTTTGDLVFTGNSELKNITMDKLTKVDGGFTISRNDKLRTIEVPNLETVTGAIDFSGKFNTVDMDSLEDVEGGFNLQSTDGNFSCSTFKKMQEDNVIKGTYKCAANTSDPTTANGKSGTTSGSSSSSSSTSSGAAVANGAALPVAGLAALFYGLAQLL